jgi:hypothetical protein
MRQIDDFFSFPSGQETLWHYTSIRALISIVESRKIWLSHAFYLSDSREIVHARDVLEKLILSKIDSYEGEEKNFVAEFGNWIHSIGAAYQIFIFSLSEKRSLLSQWRAYTPHGKGVCIGFSVSRLIHVLEKYGFRLARCIYTAEEHREILSSLLSNMMTTFRRRLSQIDTRGRPPCQKYYPFFDEFRGDILQVLAIIKAEPFQEEREWRIISRYFPSYVVPDVKFREGASMLMPYIEIDLSFGDIEKPFIETVLLGPSQHAELSMTALSNFLSNRKACNRTENSGIPYRQW